MTGVRCTQPAAHEKRCQRRPVHTRFLRGIETDRATNVTQIVCNCSRIVSADVQRWLGMSKIIAGKVEYSC
eukprot:scaffold59341_cov43-Prasinocladus_malaysianus.AAC.1